PPKGNLLTVLEDQRRETQQLLAGRCDAKAVHRYAPGKWSIKEVIGHLMDTERVFCYRALAFGRADASPLPGFDEKAWAPAGRFDARSLKDLAAELDVVRRATIALFSGLDADALARRGPGTVFLSQSWKFTAPVYIGDTITAEALVLSVHDTKPVCQLAIKVIRQTGETVLEGEAWCYTFAPSDTPLPAG